MKTQRINNQSRGVRRALFNPSIFVSPALRSKISTAEIRSALHQHRTLDSLPCGFLDGSGRKLIVATTVDYSQTMLLLPHEFERYANEMELRVLNEITALE